MNFRYNHEKNAELLKLRGIGFEEIIQSIADGNLLEIRKHHNQVKYPNQEIMYLRVLKEVICSSLYQRKGRLNLFKNFVSESQSKKRTFRKIIY
jgi:uncharacterized DUF497 family protein